MCMPRDILLIIVYVSPPRSLSLDEEALRYSSPVAKWTLSNHGIFIITSINV